MLIHVTRFTSVQAEVHRTVRAYVDLARQKLTRRIGHEELERQLKQLGTAKDALDYADHAGKGLKVIAIGGDKLSRGLTLEGLCTSYFLRTSKMYDTLMQMGRWFGYRPGYADLCRLYTTQQLAEWFGHIADAAEELREEFDLMAAAGATPRDFGLKVQSHSVLLVTSRLKMRSARSLLLSFSGQICETVSLFKQKDVLERNLEATKEFLGELGHGETDPVRERGDITQSWKGRLWSGVPAQNVTNYLSAYRTHPEAYKVNSTLLSEFISRMNKEGELTHWTAAVIGGGEGDSYNILPDLNVSMLQRAAGAMNNRYAIGRLLSPRDETIDLTEGEWAYALQLTRQAWHADPGRRRSKEEPTEPSGPAIRRVRGGGVNGQGGHPDRGLLLIYLLDPAKAGSLDLSSLPPVVGIGLSFPGSEAGVKVEYKVNNVAWTQEYGGAD
jgi:hypothetical protein